MEWDGEMEFAFGRKAPPRKGRRAGMGLPSSPQGDGTCSPDDLVDSPSHSIHSSGLSRNSTKMPEDFLPIAPPRSRRTGGWADEAIKSGKRRSASSNLIEQERFRSPERGPGDSDDDIPVIPDLDEVHDDDFGTQVAHAPLVAVNRVAAYKELDSDLFRHAAFATLDDVNLRLLTKCLNLEAELKENDECWTWDLLFTDVASELHNEWESDAANEKDPIST